MKMIASDRPDFEEMIKALTANPDTAAKEYKKHMLRLEMTVDSVKAMDKEHYLAKGTAGSVSVQTAFFLPPNSLVNSQVKSLSRGDKVTFYGKLGSFKPGSPRGELIVNDGSILSVDPSAK
jgi:hypothetical protein